MNVIDTLIQKIEDLQIKEKSEFYNLGMFPTQRSNRFLGYCREDSNIYYTALIAFTILPLLENCSNEQQEKLNNIIINIRRNYSSYANTQTPSIYNFYQTNPPNYYPNGYFLSKFKHFKLADDADDTCIISMTLEGEHRNKSEIHFIREQLVKFSNLHLKKITATFTKYKNLRAYGVWFGSGKMPIEFDLCVITNILCFTFKNKCKLLQQDIDSLLYIKTAILDNDIETNPFVISYMYPNPVVILYHIARLWSLIPNPDKYLPTRVIIEKLKKHLESSELILEKMLVSSSLIKMNIKVTPLNYSLAKVEKEFFSFGFFRAPMLKGTANKLFNSLAKLELFHLLFDCNGYYYTLVLEYEILLKTIENNQFMERLPC